MFPTVIKTAAEHTRALAYVERLMDAAPGSKDERLLEVWGVLIEKYEEEHFPIPRPDPIAAIEFRMEQRGMTRQDLQQFIPSKSKVSEILGRRRPLSLPMIRSLHQGLAIPSEVLLQEARGPYYVKARLPVGKQAKTGSIAGKYRSTKVGHGVKVVRSS